MNYLNHYNRLICKAKTGQTDDKTEEHHILPRSMGGTNDPNNLVNLTLKEHYLAHHLLWKIYKNKEMTHAFWMMSHIRGVKISAKTYEKLRTTFIDNCVDRMRDSAVRENLRQKNLGHAVSAETRKKISDALSGRTQDPVIVTKRADSNRGLLCGKSFEEIHGASEAKRLKKNLSDKNIGKTQSEETIEKIKKSMMGHECTNVTRDKISKANTGKKRTDDFKKNVSMRRSGLTMDNSTKNKISEKMKGVPKSEETRQKMKKPKTEEHKRKISETKQRKKLEILNRKFCVLAETPIVDKE